MIFLSIRFCYHGHSEQQHKQAYGGSRHSVHKADLPVVHGAKGNQHGTLQRQQRGGYLRVADRSNCPQQRRWIPALLYSLHSRHGYFAKCVRRYGNHHDFFVLCGDILKQTDIVDRRKYGAQCDQQYAGKFHHKLLRIIRIIGGIFVVISPTQHRSKPHRGQNPIKGAHSNEPKRAVQNPKRAMV